MSHKKITGCLVSTGILALILDAETASSGASAGLDLCIRTVIPSLFPFLFLCNVLTNSLWGGQVYGTKQLCRMLGIPTGADSVLISAFLGGYPAGAQAVGSAYREGNLTSRDAEHLLTFCSNAGPAFLFGMTGTLFPEKSFVCALWVIQILSAVMTAVAGRHTPGEPVSLSSASSSLSVILVQTVKVMGAICGWVMLFRILTAFLEKWVLFAFPNDIQVIITGILELSNGCCALSAIEDSSLRFIICAGFLSFGGICVVMQTASVIGGLPLRPYLAGKAIQTLFSLILSCLYLQLGWFMLLFPILFLGVFSVSVRKKCGFPAAKRV